MSRLQELPSSAPATAITLRPAVQDDIPAIDAMHFLSVQALGVADYSPAEIEAFLGEIGTYDPSLIDDGTYFVAENRGQVVASGGWSDRTPRHPDAGFSDDLRRFTLSPYSAKIRSVFVHPKYARLGLGSRIVRHAEAEALSRGHRLLELWASLTGVPLYCKLGYQLLDRMEVPCGNGAILTALHMAKVVGQDCDAAVAA